jgi:hypothetical protein
MCRPAYGGSGKTQQAISSPVAGCAPRAPRPVDAPSPYARGFGPLPSESPRASQPSCARPHRPSRRWPLPVFQVRPFAGVRPGTLASADSWPAHGAPSLWQATKSPRARPVAVPPSTRRICAAPGRVTSSFRYLCPLARLTDASYAVRVPRAGGLPPASFPHHLTTVQLPFGSGFLSPRSPEDSHLRVTRHAWRTKKSRPTRRPGGE